MVGANIVNLYAWQLTEANEIFGYTGLGFSVRHRAQNRWFNLKYICWRNDSIFSDLGSLYRLWGWNAQRPKYHWSGEYWTSPRTLGFASPRAYIEAELNARKVEQEYGS